MQIRESVNEDAMEYVLRQLRGERRRAVRRVRSEYEHVSGSMPAARLARQQARERGNVPRLRQVWRTPDGVETRRRRPGSIRVRVPR